MKDILIIGSTGSIGTQALDVVRKYPDKFRISGLAVGSNTELLEKQIDEFKPKFVSVEKKAYNNDNTIVLDNVLELVKETEYDIILLAMVGIDGLEVAYQAAKSGKRVALANKETLVAAGSIIMNAAKDNNTEIIPVDSEHSAIWQCLNAGEKTQLKQILLTASGGAFRDKKRDELTRVKAREALKHPVWNMGAKVTIDSATLMNKGLEIIEAMHLFDVGADKIKVIIHPESIIHSMVEYLDNSVIAELSTPDMRLPIQLAFTYPKKVESNVSALDFYKLKSLTFYEPDTIRFPCLDIAYKCAKAKGIAPLIMNAANEIAVREYLYNRITFYDIPTLIESALDKYIGLDATDINDILCIDRNIKEYILTLVT